LAKLFRFWANLMWHENAMYSFPFILQKDLAFTLL
jgi:hypothetical protein